jgi:transposase InsO family protein
MGTQGDGCAPIQKTSQSSYIKAPVGDRLSTILVDTGASHSFISKHMFDNEFKNFFHLFTYETKSIIVANNTPMNSEGYVEMKIEIGSISTTAKLWILENLCTGIILGLDWLTSNAHKASINFDTNSLSICSNEKKSSTPLIEVNINLHHQVRICNKFTLNPMEEKIIEVKIADIPNCDTAQFNPTPRLLYQDSVLIPYALINVKNYKALLTITNISNRIRIFNKNTSVGTIEIESPNSSCFLISSSTYSPLPPSAPQQSNDTENTAISAQIIKTIEEMTCHLNIDQKQLLLPILHQNNSLFDMSKPKIANTHIHHTIQTSNNNPVNSRPYRVNPEKQQIIDDEIHSMYKFGLIRPSQSAWSSPVVLVKKKDGKFRFCVDNRRLNQVTIKDSYPLPNMEDPIKQLGGSTFFSKLDLKSGYFQIPINERDKPKTAFITSRGLWEFNVLPQGLKNSPPSFQRILNNLLANGRWQFCLIYLDDIIIFSRSFNEHCEQVNNVLTVLSKANFQLNPPKCSFAKSEMDYLGHTVDVNGFRPLNTNIDAIVKVPDPRTAKQVHSFLQMANFYRKFINNFTELTRPLRPFQKKNMKFYWNEREQSAWDGLKMALTTPPVFLNFPMRDDKTKKNYPYILSTDASKFGIAGALKQQTPDGIKPIVYISRTLNSAERNYSTFERECLGIVWAVTKLRDYLADETFVIETDQQPARNIHLNRSSTNRRVNNWKLQLQDYDIIEIKHKPGTTNCDADYMSRHPLINQEEPNDELDGICVVMTRSKTKQQDITTRNSSPSSPTSIISASLPHLKKVSPLDPQRLKNEQQYDPEIQQKIREIGREPNDRYSILNGTLNTKLRDGKYVPFIPTALRNEILSSFHDHPTAGHFGRDKTWYRLKDRCFWPNMRQDVIIYIQSCSACAQHNIRRHKAPGQMQLIEPPGGVFDLVQMDFTGPFTTSTNGNRYVISLTDYLSKYVISKAVPNDSAKTAAEFFVDISLEFGPPHQLQTDRGSHFTSTIFEAVAKRLGCVHTVSTPYHPQSQGVIERFNATFKQQLAKYTNEHYDDWDEYLKTIVSAYNSSVHQVTQFTPFQIFHKRKPVSVFDPIQKQVNIPRVNDYWNYFLRFEKVYMDQVRWNIRQQQQLAKRRYDRNRPNIQFEIGQKAFIIKPGMHPAFGELYEGPYTIIKQLGPQTFDVIDINERVKRVHSSQMKSFLDRE